MDEQRIREIIQEEIRKASTSPLYPWKYIDVQYDNTAGGYASATNNENGRFLFMNKNDVTPRQLAIGVRGLWHIINTTSVV